MRTMASTSAVVAKAQQFDEPAWSRTEVIQARPNRFRQSTLGALIPHPRVVIVGGIVMRVGRATLMREMRVGGLDLPDDFVDVGVGVDRSQPRDMPWLDRLGVRRLRNRGVVGELLRHRPGVAALVQPAAQLPDGPGRPVLRPLLAHHPMSASTPYACTLMPSGDEARRD